VKFIPGFILVIVGLFLTPLFFQISLVASTEEDTLVMEDIDVEHVGHNDLGSLHHLHIVQIIVLLFVAILAYDVIKADTHKNILVYLLIAMIVFAGSTAIGHLPNISDFPKGLANKYVLILNTITLFLTAIGFYKWRKTLL